MEAKILPKIKLLDADQIELGIGFPIRCLGITLLLTASICLRACSHDPGTTHCPATTHCPGATH